ncbi:hypothetical protein [Leisingera aquimarina]|nr:hypothetical protein [Leisingera aquimarina]
MILGEAPEQGSAASDERLQANPTALKQGKAAGQEPAGNAFKDNS